MRERERETCPSVLKGKESNEVHHEPSNRDEHEAIMVHSRRLKRTLHTHTHKHIHINYTSKHTYSKHTCYNMKICIIVEHTCLTVVCGV